MLNDYWVISQLLGQLCSWALLCIGLVFSVQLIKNWQTTSNSEGQISLERSSYLIGAIVQFGLLFQVILLLMFLNTVNIHLTGQIEGAMCAIGVLGANDYGYPLLYLKLISLLSYALYLIFNYFDQREPEYPLTPIKFWFIFPAFALMSLDLFWTFRFFSLIEPNIIATCCSVSFLSESSSPFALYQTANHLPIYLWAWSGLFLLMAVMSFFWLKPFARLGFWYLQSVLGIVYVVLSVFLLKNFFVKYIYGLPSHNCLFDIFWAKYYYIGFVLYGSYALIWLCLLLGTVFQIFRHHLSAPSVKFWYQMQWTYLSALVAGWLILWAYWYAWGGLL